MSEVLKYTLHFFNHSQAIQLNHKFLIPKEVNKFFFNIAVILKIFLKKLHIYYSIY
jgi:hypothetical protein